jgi:2-haloacid dehalogenase
VIIAAVVTAEAVRSCKPSHGHFQHFADSFPTVWDNRQREVRDASIAGAMLPDLGGVVAAVESVAGG